MTNDNQTTWYLAYPLRAGFVHNWVVAGPQVVPATSAVRAPAKPEIVDAPSERAKFTLTGPGGARADFTWRYLACADDHLVNLAESFPPQRFVRAWAYTELVAAKPQTVTLALESFGPAQIWINDRLVLAQCKATHSRPTPVTAVIPLATGANRVLVRLAHVTDDPAPCAFRLQIAAAAGRRLRVQVPTRNRAVAIHQSVERLAARAYVEQNLYAGAEALHVKWPRSLRGGRGLMIRVEKPSGAIVGEVQPQVVAGLSQHTLEASWVKDGRYTIKILPDFDSFVSGLRISRDLDVSLLHSDYAADPSGDLNERAVELLKHAAWWCEGIFATVAAMALGLWKQVNVPAILRAGDAALAQEDDHDRTLLGLLLMAYRFAEDPAFPADLAPRLEEWLLRYPYADVAAPADGLAEDRAILGHACRVLAGQRYPDRTFASDGQRGSRHQAAGEQAALAWLARRARGGFAAGQSGEGYAAMLLALVALADHAANDTLSDLAAATADKVLVSLATHSFRGVLGSARGATAAASVTDGRMDPTAPIMRLLWGVGCWNQHMAAGVALATSRSYGCPPLLQHIALDPAEVWVQERHATGCQGDTPLHTVNTVAYRTADYLLASAQEDRPGESGRGEHVWQATLGPAAVVFVNNPQVVNQKDAYAANFWRGNGSRPRVAQWRDLLIAHYRLPADDWLGYTHAHFPRSAFDETKLRDGWAFGRKGDGYIALTAAAGFKSVSQGPGAFRELRSPAATNTWLCQMGRAAQDGSFAEFQQAVLRLPVTFGDADVELVSLRGDRITFGWTGPLTVQGAAQPLDGFAHHASPYCVCPWGATALDVRYGEWALRLDLEPVVT